MNLYWSIYENLESEILRIADDILFTDKQLNVYSLNIANLIIRCAVEIEAISKELYTRLGGLSEVTDKKTNEKRPPYFDTECLALINQKWKTNVKEIQISSIKMDFSPDNAILKPLHKSDKRGISGSKWKQAYQAIKHDRRINILEKNATVLNLLNALGALYILNLYYKDGLFWENLPIAGHDEYKTQSKIFSPFVFNATGSLSADTSVLPDEKSIYIKKYTDDSALQIMDLIHQYNLSIWAQVIKSNEFIHYKQKNPLDSETIDVDFIQKIGLNFSTLTKNMNVPNLPPEVYRRHEIVLNKNQRIYPERTFTDFRESDKAKKIIADATNVFIQNINQSEQLHN